MADRGESGGMAHGAEDVPTDDELDPDFQIRIAMFLDCERGSEDEMAEALGIGPTSVERAIPDIDRPVLDDIVDLFNRPTPRT